MIFLVLLLTIAAYKLLGWHLKPEHDQWFFQLSNGLSARLKDSPRLAMLLALLLPLVIVGVILNATKDWLFGFVGVLLHVVILFYAFGRVNLLKQLCSYLEHWRSGDYQSAYHHAQQQFSSELEFAATDTNSLHLSCCRGLLYQWFEQIFVIIFWYLLAGPLAALFVRLLSLYERNYQASKEGGLQLLYLVEWLPVRLMALTYAIAGNFSQSFKILVTVIADITMSTDDVLLKTGLAATGVEETEMSRLNKEQKAQQLETLQRLQVRCLIVCVVLVALLTIL